MILIIFDVDGTLVYSDRLDSQSFAQLFQEIYEHPFPTIDFSYYPHVSDTTIFDTAIEECFQRPTTPEEVAYFKQRFVMELKENRKRRPTNYRAVPGAPEMMAALDADHRYAVGVATGGWEQPAYLKLKHVGIETERLFFRGADGFRTREEIVNASLGLARNAHPEIERVVYVGDALWDVQTTRNLRMNFVGVRRKEDHHVLREAGANLVITNFLDFAGFKEAIDTAVPPI